MNKNQVSATLASILISTILIRAEGTNTIPKVSQNTNTTNTVRAIDYDRAPLQFDQNPKTVGGQFLYNFQDRADSRSEKRLHLFNTIFRQMSEEGLVETDEAFGKIGRDIVSSSVTQGTREVAKDIPLIFRALNQDSFISRLFRDSLGNTAEEDLGAGDISYSTNEVAQWKSVSGEADYNTNAVPRWQRFRRHFHPRYGSRLDYAYYAFVVTRQGKGVFYGDLRYHYGQAGLGDIASTDLEVLASVPIGRKTLLSGGFLQEVDLSHWDRRWSIRMSHKIDGARVYLGVTGRDAEGTGNMKYILGIEKRW
ncbi:MAG: hypothetical protein AAB381_02700 [Patescibacteria group bacterium]